jgi:hypothetical protein
VRQKEGYIQVIEIMWSSLMSQCAEQGGENVGSTGLKKQGRRHHNQRHTIGQPKGSNILELANGGRLISKQNKSKNSTTTEKLVNNGATKFDTRQQPYQQFGRVDVESPSPAKRNPKGAYIPLNFIDPSTVRKSTTRTNPKSSSYTQEEGGHVTGPLMNTSELTTSTGGEAVAEPSLNDRVNAESRREYLDTTYRFFFEDDKYCLRPDMSEALKGKILFEYDDDDDSLSCATELKGLLIDDPRSQDHGKFVDETFGHGDLFISDDRAELKDIKKNAVDGKIYWKRVADIRGGVDFTLFPDNAVISNLDVDNSLISSANQIKQGFIANCWLACAMYCMALRDALVPLVLHANLKRGFYKFMIKDLDGRFKQVVVDDYLPCILYSQKGGAPFWTPIYAHSPNLDNVIIPLLEKAIAKLRGSYCTMNGNTTGLGFGYLGSFPFTPYTVSLSDPEKLWYMLHKYANEFGKYAMICGSKSTIEDANRKGMVVSHAYSILKAIEIERVHHGHETTGKTMKRSDLSKSSSNRDRQEPHGFRLIAIRNPWGRFGFHGEFDLRAPSYRHLAQILEIWDNGVDDSDGETEEDTGLFWMTYEEFLANMSQVLVVELTSPSTMQKYQKAVLLDHSTEDPAVAAARNLVISLKMTTTLSKKQQAPFDARIYVRQLHRGLASSQQWLTNRLNCLPPLSA